MRQVNKQLIAIVLLFGIGFLTSIFSVNVVRAENEILPPFLLTTVDDQLTINMYLSNENGTFTPESIGGIIYGVKYGEFAIADFNGDGRLDFIASTNENPAVPSLFTRSSSTSFIQTPLLDTDKQQIALESDPKSAYYLALGEEYDSLAPDYGLGLTTVDLDNDGDMDFLENFNVLFTLNNGTTHYWIAKGNAYLNNGSGNFTKLANAYDFSPIFTDWVVAMSNNLADVDGDGYPDMLASEQYAGSAVSSKVYLLKGKGDGTLELVGDYVFMTNHHPASSMALGDFNNDGKVDAIVGQDDDGDPGAAFLFLGHGDGTFDKIGTEAFDTRNDIESGYDQAGVGMFRAYDADHDGILDIISARRIYPLVGNPPDAQLVFFRGRGDGTFDDLQIIDTTIDTNVFTPTAFTTPAHVIGDLDYNNCVDKNDLQIILAEIFSPEPRQQAYDLNGDGELNIADARKLVTLFYNNRGIPCLK
jgi:hypothetical protein